MILLGGKDIRYEHSEKILGCPYGGIQKGGEQYERIKRLVILSVVFITLFRLMLNFLRIIYHD